MIPVLEDGDLTLFESGAITAYLSKKYKEQGEDLLRLKGGNLKEEAMVGLWLNLSNTHLLPATLVVTRSTCNCRRRSATLVGYVDLQRKPRF